MLTELGLRLQFDANRSGTENLFRQLFGRWPHRDCESWEEACLLCILNEMELSNSLYGFFGLGGFERHHTSDEELVYVDRSLRAIRMQASVEILCLFDECPLDEFEGKVTRGQVLSEKIGKSDPEKLGSFCSALVTLLGNMADENRRLKEMIAKMQ